MKSIRNPAWNRRFSRRAVLKIGAALGAYLTLGSAISGCGTNPPQTKVAAVETSAPAPTETTVPTQTAAPTATPVPTAMPTATKTPPPTRVPTRVVQSVLDLKGSRILKTKDNRDLCFTETGKPDGIPVVLLHITPGTRIVYQTWADDATQHGIRLISYDRPGYGGSTVQPGRKIASAANDVAAIAKELGLDRISVVGLAVGGSHALACAALLPNLVTAAVSMASTAPYPAKGLDWFSLMHHDSYFEYENALKGRDDLRKYLESYGPGFDSQVPEDWRIYFRSINNPDAEALDDDYGNYLLNLLRENLKSRLDGWMDDDLALMASWGFDFSQIKIPVLLQQGQWDVYVPVDHAKWLAEAIQTAELRIYPNEGSFSLSVRRMAEAFDWIASKSKA